MTISLLLCYSTNKAQGLSSRLLQLICPVLLRSPLIDIVFKKWLQSFVCFRNSCCYEHSVHVHIVACPVKTVVSRASPSYIKEREGLANHKICVFTVHANSVLHPARLDCLENGSRFCLAYTGEAWRSVCHDDSLSV